MNELRVTYEPDDQWMGRVKVSVTSGAFSGEGAAWMNVDDLTELANAVQQYPLAEETPPFEGGLGEQKIVRVSVKPFDALGRLLVVATLATEVWEGGVDKDLHQNVTTRFLAEYASLERFAISLRGLASGQTDVAVLEGRAV